jgi:hypothetical protein
MITATKCFATLGLREDNTHFAIRFHNLRSNVDKGRNLIDRVLQQAAKLASTAKAQIRWKIQRTHAWLGNVRGVEGDPVPRKLRAADLPPCCFLACCAREFASHVKIWDPRREKALRS